MNRIKRLAIISLVLFLSLVAPALSADWYCNCGDGATTGYYAVAQWALNTSYPAGSIVRQLAAPAVGSERCFVSSGGTSNNVAEPAWTLTKADTTVDNDITWTECTGNSTYRWTAPHARLTSALSWAADGDTIYVSNNHAETQASAMLLYSSGTFSNLVRVLCVNDGATPPTALATTATVSTTGANALEFRGSAYYYGITFNAGSTTNNASIGIGGTTATGFTIILESCKLVLANTNSGARIILCQGAAGGAPERYVRLINTPLKFGATGQHIVTKLGFIDWLNSSVDAAGSAPTVLFEVASISCLKVEGVDLSALGAGKSLLDPNQTNNQLNIALFKNCKLGGSVAVLSDVISSQGSQKVYLDNCDSADPSSGPRTEAYTYQGSIKSSLTTYYNSGATDGQGHYSQKFTSLATGPSFYSPLESRPIAIWNSTTGGAKTVTVEILHDSTTNLTDGDIWLEVQYLGTSGFPLSSISSGRKGIMATAADHAAGAGTGNWTGSGGMANPNSQKMTVTFTPQEKGYLLVRVMMGKANYTAYVDPKITVTP